MKRSWISLSMLACVCVAGLMISGCNDKGGNAVAVVDLDAVAKALGKDQSISKQLQDANAQINQQISKIGQDFQRQLKEAADKAGAKPTDEDKKHLRAMQTEAEQKFGAVRQAGGNKLREFQVQLADDFRKEVKPIAERFARQRGASVVMVSTGLILWMDNQIDITADVIGAMRSAPTAAAPTAPATNGTTPAPAPKN